MKYRDFGNTGIKVSALGFGAMRLPKVGDDEGAPVDMEKSVPMLQKGLDLGINYIDSAWRYLNETCDKAVGAAVAGRDRGKLYLSTKNPIDTDDVKEWRYRLDIQLKNLQTDYIDFYHIHGLQWSQYKNKAEPEGYMDELRKARDEGLIRHISFPCHDNPVNIFKLIDTGEFSSMLVQYNLLHRHNDAVMAHARKKGMGVAVMGPIGGGRIAFMSRLKPSEDRSLPELSLRFALSNPNVSVALSGMNTMEMIEENTATAGNDGPLSDTEKQDIQTMLDQLKDLGDLYCTGCGYCMPCEQGVDIPSNFLLYNYSTIYEFGPGILANYEMSLGRRDAAADFCTECGDCIEKCSQDIDIPERMKDVAQHFEGLKNKAASS
ncbi:MAG: aldo/keto reductase [Deltaproteobacteria bacterium]|nr:aldo/keto reductase [Deltaproteobacteria bacterium]